MSSRNTAKTRRADSPDTWPVFWRVVAPGAGSYNHDMVFVETESEEEARADCRARNRQGWPCRLERIQAGPLPHAEQLAQMRAANPQNAGDAAPQVMCAWAVQS